jgi:hypothetical protein
MSEGDSGVQLNGKRKRKKSIVIPCDGDPCPRCGKPMQIRGYDEDQLDFRRPLDRQIGAA